MSHFTPENLATVGEIDPSDMKKIVGGGIPARRGDDTTVVSSLNAENGTAYNSLYSPAERPAEAAPKIGPDS